ncbi:hypothetical protein N7534_002915 [Penicillium rubens]|nr:hypothetical protein N7534_002915 [Penicillium rubens]
MPFRKLRKSLKRLFSFKARRVVPPNGNDNLPQVTETERASKVSQVPSLETLPAELRRHILLIVEIDSLKALVQASPIYFHQYQLDRKTILCGSLEATLGNALADAYAVQMSSSSKLAPPNNPEEAEDILQYYHTILAQTSLNPLHKLLSMEEARSMVKFHCSIVQPLMQCFVKRTSSNLTKTKGVEIGETFNNSDGLLTTPILRGLELLHLVNSRIKNDEDLIMVKFCMIQRFCGIPGRNNLDFDDFLRRKLVPHVDCTDPFAGALIQR